jgi:hypothetical protein
MTQNIDTANWMASLNRGVRVIDSYIPASHDASARPTVEAKVPNTKHDGFIGLFEIVKHEVGDIIEQVTSAVGGAITQSGDYAAQLEAGSRYFDVRCRFLPSPSSQFDASDVYLHHGIIYFDSFEEALAEQIMPWAKTHREVIFLDLDIQNSYPGAPDETNKRLEEEIAPLVLSLIEKYIAAEYIATAHLKEDGTFNREVTWGDLLPNSEATCSTFVIMWNHPDNHERSWIGYSDNMRFKDDSGFDKMTIDQIIEKLDHNKQVWDKTKMFLASAIDTPDFSPVQQPVFLDSLHHKELNGWIMKQRRGDKINIVYRDFINKDYNQAAIRHLIGMNPSATPTGISDEQHGLSAIFLDSGPDSEFKVIGTLAFTPDVHGDLWAHWYNNGDWWMVQAPFGGSADRTYVDCAAVMGAAANPSDGFPGVFVKDTDGDLWFLSWGALSYYVYSKRADTGSQWKKVGTPHNVQIEWPIGVSYYSDKRDFAGIMKGSDNHLWLIAHDQWQSLSAPPATKADIELALTPAGFARASNYFHAFVLLGTQLWECRIDNAYYEQKASFTWYPSLAPGLGAPNPAKNAPHQPTGFVTSLGATLLDGNELNPIVFLLDDLGTVWGTWRASERNISWGPRVPYGSDQYNITEEPAWWYWNCYPTPPNVTVVRGLGAYAYPQESHESNTYLFVLTDDGQAWVLIHQNQGGKWLLLGKPTGFVAIADAVGVTAGPTGPSLIVRTTGGTDNNALWVYTMRLQDMQTGGTWQALQSSRNAPFGIYYGTGWGKP